MPTTDTTRSEPKPLFKPTSEYQNPRQKAAEIHIETGPNHPVTRRSPAPSAAAVPDTWQHETKPRTAVTNRRHTAHRRRNKAPGTERFDVTFPDGTVTQCGRISRTDCTWDDEFQVFTLTSDVEEPDTRSESISMDYEFYHSAQLSLECGNDYTVTITPQDINIWLSRLFLGDADGFSILYYQDVDSLVYWANQAAYRWGLRGIAIWSLGQEDLRLWEALPRQTG